MKVECPYCGAGVEVEIAQPEATCSQCGAGFKVGLTDFNTHEPREVSPRLPESPVMGVLTAIPHKPDETLCHCGTVYAKSEALCPGFVDSIRAWYSTPSEIVRLDPSLAEATIRLEIETFLAEIYGANWKEKLEAI